MTNKLDQKAIAEYCNAYSHKVCNEFFAKNEIISGSEIMNLTSVDQLNLFTIRALFENWKAVTENFKSPYFDFENPKVKDALQNFMNIASQHIAVKKDALLPLVTKAASETLTLSLSPAVYFDGQLRELPDFKLTKESLGQLKKYTRINAGVLESISDKLGAEDSVFTNTALSWLEEIIETQPTDDPDPIIAQFDQILACEKSQFFKGKKAEENTISATDSSSFFDQIGNVPVSTPPVKIDQNVVPKVEAILTPEPPKLDEPTTLNEQFQSNQPTVNEHLKPSESQTLVDLHKNTPIKNLAESISLNQRFVFINKLFNGDSMAYSDTLQILENCGSTEEALNLLKYKYAPKYQWNLNSIEADELMDILKRKA
jgi:hypothetical protein